MTEMSSRLLEPDDKSGPNSAAQCAIKPVGRLDEHEITASSKSHGKAAVSDRILGLDNLHLSRLKTTPISSILPIAVNCKETAQAGDEVNCNAASDRHLTVVELIRESLAPSTRRAYASDLSHFFGWGGSIPASAECLGSYLAEHAQNLSVATLNRRIASIAKAHAAIGQPSPAESALVKATLRGIRRTRGSAQAQAKPLLCEELFIALGAIGDGLKDTRDRALLLLGFAGGFRRSELVGLDRGDIEHVRQGLIVHLRRSKSDQIGKGRKICIPHGRSRHCPVKAVEHWLEQADVRSGAVFRVMDRHARVLEKRLSGEAVSIIVAARTAAAGLDPKGYSRHSLRAGFATSAAREGVSSWKIRAQTGHASDAMVGRYIRDGELFTSNAAGAIL